MAILFFSFLFYIFAIRNGLFRNGFETRVEHIIVSNHKPANDGWRLFKGRNQRDAFYGPSTTACAKKRIYRPRFECLRVIFVHSDTTYRTGVLCCVLIKKTWYSYILSDRTHTRVQKFPNAIKTWYVTF